MSRSRRPSTTSRRCARRSARRASRRSPSTGRTSGRSSGTWRTTRSGWPARSTSRSSRTATPRSPTPRARRPPNGCTHSAQAGCFQEGFSSTGYADAQALFTSGKAAVYNIGTWELRQPRDRRARPGRARLGRLLHAADHRRRGHRRQRVRHAVGHRHGRERARRTTRSCATSSPSPSSATPRSTRPPARSRRPPTSRPPFRTTPPRCTSAPLTRRTTSAPSIAMPWDTQLDPATNTRLQQELTLLVQGDITPDEFIETMDATLAENSHG